MHAYTVTNDRRPYIDILNMMLIIYLRALGDKLLAELKSFSHLLFGVAVGLVTEEEACAGRRFAFLPELEALTIDLFFKLLEVTVEDAVSSSSLMMVVSAGSGERLRWRLLRSCS